MRFSIITPSFRSSRWLKLCIASVADQGVEHEHIVQDSCSDDGTGEWLPHDRRVTAIIEKDSGMYDAVNRGWRRASGDVLSYLNADEQYLPGALGRVRAFFESHPQIDAVFGNVIVVDAVGGYLCERKALLPQKLHTMVSGNLSFLTAATFVRRRFVDEKQVYFDASMRAAGDADWGLRLLGAGAHMGVLPEFLAAFTETSQNLGQSALADREAALMAARAPRWAQMAAPLIVAHYRIRRLAAGAYRCRPHDYAVFTEQNPDQRTAFHVGNPTFRWRRG